MNKAVVKRPKDTVIQVQNGRRYAYATVEKRYIKEKKYNENKRVIVGRMIDDENMRPNHHYYEIYSDEEVLEEAPEYSDVLKVGTHIVFDKILEDNGLGKLMNEVYGNNSNKFKDIASYFVVGETSVMEHYETYAFDHAGFDDCIYSDSTLGAMLKDTSVVKHDLLLEKWNQIHSETEDIIISYDSTNMNSAATGANLLEYGKSKDESSDLPQVNLSIGFDQNNEEPLFYELYYGSIIDNAQCQIMVDKIKRYGYKNITFLVDRGYFSLDNIKYFDSKGYGYIIMAKANTKFVKPALDIARYEVRQAKYYIDRHEVNGMDVELPFNASDSYNRHMHVYYDDVKASLERRALLKKYAKMDKKLEELAAKKITRKANVKQFESHYTMFYQGDYLVSFKRKESVINQELDNCGYFIIVTAEPMTADKALDHYRNRDTSEKLFMYDKTFLESDAIRVYSDESIESKEMAQFIALVLRNAIHRQMIPFRERGDKNHTIPAVIRELNKIIITKDSKGIYHKRYQITKSQKEILAQFGITTEEAIKRINDVCGKYTNLGKTS